MTRPARPAAVLVIAVLAGAALWWRRHPSACPYAQRFWLEPPHPLITRARLRRALEPRAGERILEIGPGTGYYTLPLAEWIAPGGRLDLVDIQQEMLDHTMRRAGASGIAGISPRCADAQRLPYPEESFDAVVLVATLGEIPEQRAALAEIARVLKPGGRLIEGELFGDPHWVSPRAAQRGAEAAGLRFVRRLGTAAGYFVRFERPDARSAG